MNKIQKLILIAIIVLASLIRLWDLGKVPPSPDWDEAALGYNAYSIMQTGRDEYGEFLPVLLRSFDDYKPALYAYLAIPSIQLFGLNVWAVRLPSVIFGILTVLATYYLVKELFVVADLGRPKAQQAGPLQYLPILSAGLLVISPWHLQFSRIAFEANVGLALNVFGLLFFLKGLKKTKWFYLSAIVYALSFYVYQSEKVFVPLISLVLLLIFRKELWKIRKQLIFPALLFILVISPFIWVTLSTPQALLRAKGVSVFSDQTPFLARTVEKLIRDKENNDLLGLVLDNRRITYGFAFISGYLSHFDLNWLFITGDQPRHQPPGMGHLYLWELPFLLIGIYTLVFGNYSRKVKQLIFAWFLITPIPASITTGVPHPIRTLNFLPTFQIFTAAGIIAVVRLLPRGRRKRLSLYPYIPIFLYSFFTLFNFAYYLNQYFIQQNHFQSADWQYGYKEAVSFVEGVQDKYSKVIVENRPHMDQSYMFFLFYLRYDPQQYLNEGGTDSGGFAEGHKFSKYEFRPIDWDNEEKHDDILYIGRPEDFPEDAREIGSINFLDGKPAIKIVQGI